MTKEKEIRANLYIDDKEYDNFWNEWKDSIINSINKYAQNKNIKYCFESDIENEKFFYAETEQTIEIIANDNGLIFYIVKGEMKWQKNKQSKNII